MFSSIVGLKAYLFIMIKNGFKVFYNHKKFVLKATEKYIDDDYFLMQSVEAEYFSLVPMALQLLPDECATTFKYFLEGYDIKDIAKKLGKQPSTIYAQKDYAIKILRKKLPKDKLLILLYILN